MSQVVTNAIVLRRTNYGEADRILSLLTKQSGKVSVIAKGSRKLHSKLASGIELFSESEIVFIAGKRDLHTLRSAKLLTQWTGIVSDLDRSNTGFELLKTLDRIIEETEGAELYEILHASLATLHKEAHIEVVKLWFASQILQATGHTPNLKADVARETLHQDKRYSMLIDQGTLQADQRGILYADHIKLLRLAVATDITTLVKVNVNERTLQESAKTMWDFMKYSLHF